MRLVTVAAVLVFTGLVLMCSPALADAAKASLTIDTQSSDIWFNVDVMGTAIPAGTMLADPAGEHVADVAISQGPCPQGTPAVSSRETGLTGPAWCVHVSNLQVGYSVSGTIATPATALSLTVNRKACPKFPLSWSAVALACAVLISLLSSTYVPGLTSRLRRWYNEHDRGIIGLGTWVENAAADGLMSDDDIAARAKWARKYGRRQVMAVRKRLDATLKGGSDLEGSPLWTACKGESVRTEDDIKRDDVLTDNGARSTTAASLLDALAKASTAMSDFKSSADAIIADLEEPEKRQAQQDRDEAVSSAKLISETDVLQFTEGLSAILDTMRSSSQERAFWLRGGGQFITIPAIGRRLRVTAAELDTSVKDIFAPVAVYIPAVLLAFVVMAGAVAAVFSAQYLANPHFGTLSDYWALILSSYGSAQAAAIAAALLLIRSPKPWYG